MSKRGVLLLNLGTPQSPSLAHVRAYLREFLSDPRVIDIPRPLRFLLVNGIISPFRAPRSAEAYRSIWTSDGSPLLLHSRRLAAEVKARVGIPVELAMRYGIPSIVAGMLALRAAGVKSITALPLFPQYAMSSYESAAEALRREAARLRMSVTVLAPFYQAQGYLDAMTTVAAPLLRDSDHLLFSFHGIPERHLRKTDLTGTCCLRSADCCDRPNAAHATCYRHQCLYVATSLARQLGLSEDGYSIAFQSRLGRKNEWLKPATDKHLEELGRLGIKRLAVICPSFTSDCLETLEEIGLRGKRTFLSAGGERLTLIPCLNDHPAWVEEVTRMVTEPHQLVFRSRTLAVVQ